MNAFDIILLTVLAGAVILAILSIRRNKKNGRSCSCGGDCSRCAGCHAANCKYKDNSDTES
jgi:hypothetical protein